MRVGDRSGSGLPLLVPFRCECTVGEVIRFIPQNGLIVLDSAQTRQDKWEVVNVAFTHGCPSMMCLTCALFEFFSILFLHFYTELLHQSQRCVYGNADVASSSHWTWTACAQTADSAWFRIAQSLSTVNTGQGSWSQMSLCSAGQSRALMLFHTSLVTIKATYLKKKKGVGVEDLLYIWANGVMYSQLTYSGSESAVNCLFTMIETHSSGSSGGSRSTGLVEVLNHARPSSDRVNPTESLECAGTIWECGGFPVGQLQSDTVAGLYISVGRREGWRNGIIFVWFNLALIFF